MISPEDADGRRILFRFLDYDPLMDSSNMTHVEWQRIARDICHYYLAFDGFVVLHGTDTMAYTASALSFFLENLGKPVVLTGSQIPICRQRNDGLMNLVGALNVAAFHHIPEVCALCILPTLVWLCVCCVLCVCVLGLCVFWVCVCVRACVPRASVVYSYEKCAVCPYEIFPAEKAEHGADAGHSFFERLTLFLSPPLSSPLSLALSRSISLYLVSLCSRARSLSRSRASAGLALL